MKRDLKSFMSGGAADPGTYGSGEAERIAETLGGAAMGGIKDAVEHYSGKSDSELMGELMGLRNAGVIDDAAMDALSARLAPMLNSAQRSRLDSLMSQLRGR